ARIVDRLRAPVLDEINRHVGPPAHAAPARTSQEAQPQPSRGSEQMAAGELDRSVPVTVTAGHPEEIRAAVGGAEPRQRAVTVPERQVMEVRPAAIGEPRVGALEAGYVDPAPDHDGGTRLVERQAGIEIEGGVGGRG